MTLTIVRIIDIHGWWIKGVPVKSHKEKKVKIIFMILHFDSGAVRGRSLPVAKKLSLFQNCAFLRAYACRERKMPIFPFLLIKCSIGIVSLFSNSQWVDLTHICIKATSLLAIVIEIIHSCPLLLWSINQLAILKRLLTEFSVFEILQYSFYLFFQDSSFSF